MLIVKDLFEDMKFYNGINNLFWFLIIVIVKMMVKIGYNGVLFDIFE